MRFTYCKIFFCCFFILTVDASVLDTRLIDAFMHAIHDTESYLNSCQTFNNELLTAKQLIQDVTSQLFGGSIGYIHNKTNHSYVFGKISFENDSLKPYSKDNYDCKFPDEWIVIPAGEKICIDISLKDLLEKEYGYYGLILYADNPKSVTSLGTSSLHSKLKNSFTQDDVNISPFKKYQVNYREIYELAGGDLLLIFHNASGKICISRTTNLLQRSHAIIPNYVLDTFSFSRRYKKSDFDKKNYSHSYFSTAVKDGDEYKSLYWPLVWSFDITISKNKIDFTVKPGMTRIMHYTMPLISHFAVHGLQTFENYTFNTKDKQIRKLALALEEYNAFVKNAFKGFVDFLSISSDSVDIPILQTNSYGKLPDLETMSKDLILVDQALREKPIDWSYSMWNMIIHIWNDVKKEPFYS